MILNKNLVIANRTVARQLCTQYVKGVSSDPVTLKSRLRVTQDHWKLNH